MEGDLQRLFILCTWIYSEPVGQSQNFHLTIFFIYCMKSFVLLGQPYFSDRANHRSSGWWSGEVLTYSVVGIPSVTDDLAP